MPVPNIGDMATVTIESRTRKLADNMSDNNALLYRLRRRGKIKPVSGGTEIRQELNYANNQTYKRISGYENIDPRPSQVFDSAKFEPKESVVAVTFSERERRINMGKERMIELIANRVSNAEMTMMNMLGADLYSDGTADGGKQIDGLRAAIPIGGASGTTNTGTYGSINRAEHEFWRPRTVKTGGINASTNPLRKQMIKLWTQLCRNSDHPDLIVADNNAYENFWGELQDQTRYMSTDMARAGFNSLKFGPADVILDGGIGGSAPANSMYFLNCGYLFWRPYAGADMTAITERVATTQLATIKPIYFMGNLTCSNQQLQGAINMS